MSVGYFITGTDTGVGKTVVGAALASAAASQGRPVLVRKPVQSGGGTVEPGPNSSWSDLDDAAFLWMASGRSGPLEQVTTVQLAEPLAPSVAAERAKTPIDIQELRGALVEARQDGWPIVEGVGGWRVWLDGEHSVRDLAIAADLPVVVVVANRLGAINHAVLTVEAIRSDGLDLAGVVLNAVAEPDLSCGSNLAEIATRTGLPVLPFPRLASVDRSALLEAGASLLRALERIEERAGKADELQLDP